MNYKTYRKALLDAAKLIEAGECRFMCHAIAKTLNDQKVQVDEVVRKLRSDLNCTRSDDLPWLPTEAETLDQQEFVDSRKAAAAIRVGLLRSIGAGHKDRAAEYRVKAQQSCFTHWGRGHNHWPT